MKRHQLMSRYYDLNYDCLGSTREKQSRSRDHWFPFRGSSYSQWSRRWNSWSCRPPSLFPDLDGLSGILHVLWPKQITVPTLTGFDIVDPGDTRQRDRYILAGPLPLVGALSWRAKSKGKIYYILYTIYYKHTQTDKNLSVRRLANRCIKFINPSFHVWSQFWLPKNWNVMSRQLREKETK